jgi:hypothetical protein
MINFSNLNKIELRRVINNLIQKSRAWLYKTMINKLNITFVPKKKNFGIFVKENKPEVFYKKYFNIKKVDFISCDDIENRISNIKNFERKTSEIKKKILKLFKHRNKKKITIVSTEADFRFFDSFSMIQKTENLKILILVCQENLYFCILLFKMIMDKLNRILKKNFFIYQKIFICFEFFFLIKFNKNKKMIDKKKIMLFSIKLILRLL